MSVLSRLLLIIFASTTGYLILNQIVENEGVAYVGFVSGLLIALVALRFEERVHSTPLRVLIGGALGLIAGLIVANLITYPFTKFLVNNPYLEISAYAFTNCVIGYIGLSIGMQKGDEFKELGIKLWDVEGQGKGQKFVIDTNIIIDGRIAEVCKTGFIKGNFLVPRFVLGEIQYIADSQDQIKKVRGKRGLDILEKLKNDKMVTITILDEDFPDISEVDMKLVALAKKQKSFILTNDINLTKVASLNGVEVLNINALASSLKPVVMPGETLQMEVVSEGKEPGQGVSYLDDGTMVVIDNARSLVGKNVTVVITSILQTTSGRMIFSRLPEAKSKIKSINSPALKV